MESAALNKIMEIDANSKRATTQPIPLPSLPPVAPFDFDMLPDALTPWARDISERLQCPPDFVAAGIMAALAAVVGRKVGIRPQGKTSWTVVPNIWACIVGRPGVLKSPALEDAVTPLNRLISRAQKKYDQEEKR
jgi:putative DNA primase/helicase